MAVQFIASVTGTAGPSATTYTLSQPTGTLPGDLMIAAVTIGLTTTTDSTPVGWTEVENQLTAASLRHKVFTRIMVSGDTTWAGTFDSDASTTVCWAVATYRGALATFIAESGVSGDDPGAGNNVVSSTVNNTDLRAWRVLTSGSRNSGVRTSTCAGNTLRAEQVKDNGTNDTGVEIFDSNGSIATGNTSGDVVWSGSFTKAAVWIGLVQPGPEHLLVTNVLNYEAPQRASQW